MGDLVQTREMKTRRIKMFLHLLILSEESMLPTVKVLIALITAVLLNATHKLLLQSRMALGKARAYSQQRVTYQSESVRVSCCLL